MLSGLTMSERLSIVRMEYVRDPDRFRADDAPLLIWDAAPAPKTRPLVWGTLGRYELEPSAHDPLVYRVKKVPHHRSNAFGVGVTVGRTQNNDIYIDEPSISRFHAFFQKDAKSGVWHIVDADSRNGTCLNGQPLHPGKPAPLGDGVEVKLGFLDLRFWLPEAFENAVILRRKR